MGGNPSTTPARPCRRRRRTRRRASAKGFVPARRGFAPNFLGLDADAPATTEKPEVIFDRSLDMLHTPGAQIFSMETYAAAAREAFLAKPHASPGVERNLVSFSSKTRAEAAGFLLKVG